jgi:hypothetical protein
VTRTRWWHGGQRFDGDLLLPPCLTGAEMLTDGCEAIDGSDDVIDRGKVYLVNDRQAAMFYACVWSDPWLYECEPIGDTEVDPDFYATPDSPLRAIRCDQARVLRRERPSAYEREIVRLSLGVLSS